MRRGHVHPRLRRDGGARLAYRTESRWGLYHQRLDHPERNDDEWFCHVQVRKGPRGMEVTTRPVAPYVVPVEGFEFHPVEAAPAPSGVWAASATDQAEMVRS